MKRTLLHIQWHEPDRDAQPLDITRARQGAARQFPVLLFHESSRKSIRLSAYRQLMVVVRPKP